MSAEDDLYAQWLKWLETIEDETMTLWLYRDYWRGLVEMTQENDGIPPSTFFDALGVWYVAAQATAVRRQLDRDPRSISLWRLLGDIAEHPEVMTRERHVALWLEDTDDERERAHNERRANENYDKFAGEGNDVIAPERTLEDRERLVTLAKPITDHVNKSVAHTDEENLAAVPTWEDLNAALDELGELLKKYVSLLKAEWLARVAPVQQTPWERAFTVAWKKT